MARLLLVEGEFTKWGLWVCKRLMCDGRPGTALLFSLTIVELLMGKGKRDEVAGPMVVAATL
jgi:hypothetical protein